MERSPTRGPWLQGEPMSPKRRMLAFVVTLLLLGGGGVAFIMADDLRLLPRGEPRAIGWEEVDRDSGYVEVVGTAHYPVRVKQTFEPTWLKPHPPTLHIFPLFAQGDTMGREISLLVISEQEPDRMLGLEDRKVRGAVTPPTSRLLTRGVLDTYRDQGYEFADGFLLLLEDPPEGG
jgi:hypothetical protein